VERERAELEKKCEAERIRLQTEHNILERIREALSRETTRERIANHETERNQHYEQEG